MYFNAAFTITSGTTTIAGNLSAASLSAYHCGSVGVNYRLFNLVSRLSLTGNYSDQGTAVTNGISDRALFVKQSLPVGETILWVLGVRWWLAMGRGQCSFECGGALK